MRLLVRVIVWAIFNFAILAGKVTAEPTDEPEVNFEQVSFIFVVGPDGYRGYSRGLQNDYLREAYISTYGLIYKNAKDAHFSLHNDAPPPDAYLYEMYLIGEGGAKKIFLTDRGLDDGSSWLEMNTDDHAKLLQLIKSKKTFHFMGFTDDLKAKKEDVVERAIKIFGSKLGERAIEDFSVFKAEYDFYLETKARENNRATNVETPTGEQQTQVAITNSLENEDAKLTAPNDAESAAANQLPSNKSALVSAENIYKPNQDESVFDIGSTSYWVELLIGIGIISILGLITYKVVNR